MGLVRNKARILNISIVASFLVIRYIIFYINYYIIYDLKMQDKIENCQPTFMYRKFLSATSEVIRSPCVPVRGSFHFSDCDQLCHFPIFLF